MSRTGYFRRAGLLARLALSMGLASAGTVGSAFAQDGPAPPPPSPVVSAPAPSTVPATEPPGSASTVAVADAAEAVVVDEPPGLPSDVQVVRFQGPEGVVLDVLGPPPEAVPIGDGKGLATVGLKVGTGYRLRLTNLPDRPGVELFPAVEIVGHLHRPKGIDPGKFPIRVVFTLDDLVDASDRGRLVTQVVYLEDPDQALPLKLGKDEPIGVSLNPAENPLRVAAALGRVMAIVRIGGRRPVPDEMGMPMGDGLAHGPCPFTSSGGAKCELPCGPVVGTAPPEGRPWIPRDEYLCDGGDRATPLHFGGDGGLRGIDPRDAVIAFRDARRPRVLPTNTVCIYAPRFASVRTTIGANESLNVQEVRAAERLEKQASTAAAQGPRKLATHASAETNRVRMRASGLKGRVYAGEHAEIRVLSGYDVSSNIAGHTRIQGPERFRKRIKAQGNLGSAAPVLLNRPEGVVMTGIIEGAGQTVMTWTPREVAGVEPPPDKPGIAVAKEVSATDAEPGDEVTYTIRFKNIGNTPINAVSIVDSLMPRLEYVPKTSMGPKGAVFTAAENKVGSRELRWDLPGAIAPGAEGYVSFRAIVR